MSEARPHAARTSFIRNALLVATVAWCSPVSAFYRPLAFSPPVPTAGEPIRMLVSVGECDSVAIFAPSDRQLVIDGDVVRVTIRGSTAFDQNFCIYPDVSVAVDLVPLPAGAYRVELYRREVDDSAVDLMIEANLVVGHGPAAPVPGVRSPMPIVILLLALTGTAATAIRRQ